MWNEDSTANVQDNNSNNCVDVQFEREMAFSGSESLQSPVRRRSLSVPCRSDAANVETVVTKAKRAASYLWMLLHAQNCRFGADRCAYAGCADAKLVHLHLKTCPAQQDFPCSTRHNGCLQARKLLAHYRRCRQIRAQQVGQSSNGKPQHVCLICSMVARQARSLLDNSTPNNKVMGQGPAHKKSTSTSSRPAVSSFTVSTKFDPVALPRTKLSPTAPGNAENASSNHSPTTVFPMKVANGPELDWKMPPPAPRVVPGMPHSAPASPLEMDDKHELHRKPGSFLAPLPRLTRKRSESLDEPPSTGCSGVRFASRPEFLEGEHRQESLVSIELEESSTGAVVNQFSDEFSAPRGRARSASCHIVSTSGPSDSCCTIYEEVGPSASSDDCGYTSNHQ